MTSSGRRPPLPWTDVSPWTLSPQSPGWDPAPRKPWRISLRGRGDDLLARKPWPRTGRVPPRTTGDSGTAAPNRPLTQASGPGLVQGWSQNRHTGAWGLCRPVEFALHSWAIDPVEQNLWAKVLGFYLTSYKPFNINVFIMSIKCFFFLHTRSW